MNTRFTALSISSTHMKMMIALRRVRTPTTPIVNRTADRARDSASTSIPPSSQNHGSGDCDEEQNAGELECEQIFVEQRARDRADCAVLLQLGGGIARWNLELPGHIADRNGHELRQKYEANERRDHHRPLAPRIGDLRRMAEIEQHDDEEKYDHDRTRVYEHLHHADELCVEQNVDRREREHRIDEPQRSRDGALPRDEGERRSDRHHTEEVEVKSVEEGIMLFHHSPFGSSGSHISQTGCVCAVSRSRS